MFTTTNCHWLIICCLFSVVCYITRGVKSGEVREAENGKRWSAERQHIWNPRKICGSSVDAISLEPQQITPTLLYNISYCLIAFPLTPKHVRLHLLQGCHLPPASECTDSVTACKGMHSCIPNMALRRLPPSHHQAEHGDVNLSLAIGTVYCIFFAGYNPKIQTRFLCVCVCVCVLYRRNVPLSKNSPKWKWKKNLTGAYSRKVVNSDRTCDVANRLRSTSHVRYDLPVFTKRVANFATRRQVRYLCNIVLIYVVYTVGGRGCFVKELSLIFGKKML